ncbi:MAG: tetratricopeptide repeat protein, partial [Rhodothermales bacterium]
MSVLRKGLLVLCACLVAALVWTGCSSEQAEPAKELTRTEKLRQTLDPEVKSFLARGQQAAQRGAYQQALALADSAQRYVPELADIYLLRGTVYSIMNRTEAAQAAYRQVIKLDPAYPDVRRMMGDDAVSLGKHREALRLYRDEKAVAPSPRLYVGMGRAYTELGVTDSARWAFEQAIALDSTEASAYLEYGQLAEEAGDLETALAYSHKALALQPDRTNYQFILGRQLFHAGRLEEALGYLEQAAGAGPLHYPAQYNLGQMLARLGRQEEADRYLALADSNQELLHQITLAEEAAARNPDAIEHWAKLGDLFHTAEMYTRASEALSVAVALDPSNLSLHYILARTLMADGRTSEAIERFQTILRADPARANVWLSLGLAYAVAGHCDDARHAWETVLTYRPGDATATEYLAGLCQYT